MSTFSVVIPVYKEEENVPRVYDRLAPVLAGLRGVDDWEIVFSLDPSPDRTEEVILALRDRDPRVKLLRFSRRFGQPAATLAGMAATTGDEVLVIDCDLQDPPELIPELHEKALEGFEVVFAQRRTREGETLPKRLVASAGYKLINRISEVEIPANTGDFRLMSRRVVDNVVALNESHGFLRGLVGFVGFRQTAVQYDRDARAAGQSKYNPFLGSILIGMNGVIGFSRRPLNFISVAGIVLSFVSILFAIVYLVLKLAGVFEFASGQPTIVILVTLFSGIQLLSLGIMGEYVGRIYDEVKHRPKVIVESAHGIDPDRPMLRGDGVLERPALPR